ncbi:MAG: flagellar basal body P-ring formation chaperone FlgA [Gemmatimonadales bacterium]
MSALSLVAALTAPLLAQSSERRPDPVGDVPVGFAARVAVEVARTWDVSAEDVVLTFGTGSLAGVPDASPFRLLGAGENGWFALVVEPVGGRQIAVRLRAGRTTLRQVATRALRIGVRLVAGDIREESYRMWGPPPTDRVARAQEGWVVRRTLGPGTPLDLAHVAPPPLVEAGQPVRIVWYEGSVSIALQGTAMNDAAMGESVRVRTGGRTGVIRGLVTASGEARMP